jgi:hypothetical protein
MTHRRRGGGPGAESTVDVQSTTSVVDGGRKLLEIKRLSEKGHRITVLDESRFWRLAERPAR